jgi:hypothetical protein
MPAMCFDTMIDEIKRSASSELPLLHACGCLSLSEWDRFSHASTKCLEKLVDGIIGNRKAGEPDHEGRLK